MSDDSTVRKALGSVLAEICDYAQVNLPQFWQLSVVVSRSSIELILCDQEADRDYYYDSRELVAAIEFAKEEAEKEET